MEQEKLNMMQNQQDDEIEINVGELLGMIWHNLLQIIEVGLCVGAVVFIVCTLLLPKQYDSTTKVYILTRQSESTTVTYSDLQTGASLTKDYRELIKSLPVMEQVTAQLNLGITPNELANRITVTTPTDSRIIEITVRDTDPYMANAMANAVRIAASKQISQVMDIEAVNIVQKASYPEGPSGPSTFKYTILGCIAGAFLAAAVLVVLYLMDDTLKTPDDVERYMGASVLGSIPILKAEAESKKKRGRKRKAKKAVSARRVRA